MVNQDKSKLKQIKQKLIAQADKKKAKILQSFFKTGKGQYARGDVFLGITVPKIRHIAKQFSDLENNDILELLKSKYHEQRLLALLIWVEQFSSAEQKIKTQIYQLYIKHTKYINNWDLVDLSAPKIIGSFLFNTQRDILYKFAKSPQLWQKRIAIVATYYFIKQNDFADTFKIARILLTDKHDLIHKAVGWMLREAGKINLAKEEEFLGKYYKNMPRTMLRYAIEKFPEEKRLKYLKSQI
ncbi:MAG: DNA alkylation repair protein [Candidatus Omnitrophica bacterium]|nr:DNA alkylation repair protein [Candidatus Omnitrophota bacterium]